MPIDNTMVRLVVKHRGRIPIINAMGPLLHPVTTTRDIAERLIQGGYNVSYLDPEVSARVADAEVEEVVEEVKPAPNKKKNVVVEPEPEDDDDDEEESTAEDEITKEDIASMTKKDLVKLVEDNNLEIEGYKNLTIVKLRAAIVGLMEE
jgi:hypothetical protein